MQNGLPVEVSVFDGVVEVFDHGIGEENIFLCEEV
jgi:hypothetical protein